MPYHPLHTVITKTRNYTFRLDQNWGIFTNEGAVGPITYTLPNAAESGITEFWVVAVANGLTVAAPEHEVIQGYFNGLAVNGAASVSFTNSNFAAIHFVYLGNHKWLIADGTVAGGGGGAASTFLPFLHIYDDSYTPIVAGAAPYFQLSTTTPIVSTGNFTGSIQDLVVTQSGDSKGLYNSFDRLSVRGNSTNATMYGKYIELDNTFATPNATNILYGLYVTVNTEQQVNTSIGAHVSTGAGGSGASGIVNLTALEAIVLAGHNGHQDNVTGVYSKIFTANTGLPSSLSLTRGVWSQFVNFIDGTYTDLRGVSIDSWTNTGTVLTSYGLYIDASIDVGFTNKYAIWSGSTSDSIFSGAVKGVANPYGAGWNGSVKFATEDAIYDKIESLVLPINPVAGDVIWDAKGDLAVGTGSNTAIRLGVGSNGQVLSADSTQATGLKWVASPSAGSIAQGIPVTGGGAKRILYEDAAQNLKMSSAFVFNDSDTLQVDNLAATDGSSGGNTLTLSGSQGPDGQGGGINVFGGSGTTTTSNAGGDARIQGGDGASDGHGGWVFIQGGRGQGADGDGGNVDMVPGFKSGAGAFGKVRVKNQTNFCYGTLDMTLLVTDRTFSFPDATYELGFNGWPQQSKIVNYTLVLSDKGKEIYHPSSDNNARTYTIPANASVPFPIGTEFKVTNEINTITIAITSDTLTLQGAGTTGSRTLAANGEATFRKVATTKWICYGTNLS